MSDPKPLELSDDYLRGLAAGRAEANDPHRLMKQSGARQRDAILAIVRPTPKMLPDDIYEARLQAAALEGKVAELKIAHKREFADKTFAQGAQASLHRIGNLAICGRCGTISGILSKPPSLVALAV